MRVDASFVRSAASAADYPRDGFPEIALVGRSNVGKSSLINALVRQRIARTSAAPGKTRLANVYRVARGGASLYLVDLPGYGYARGGRKAAEAFDELTAGYFERRAADGLLLVDARHPGLDSDRAAWRWLRSATDQAAVIATKMDKLARAERPRVCRELEAVFEHPVLPVSVVTGEGLDELWILIDKLVNSRRSRNPRPSSLPRATAAAPPRQPPTRPDPTRQAPRRQARKR